MAGARKLAGEIDRCLKQVAERVEIFNDVWDKVQGASNSNQKEKYEADLKKEIKKLQRLRDQIKTWLASSDVKTQRATLMENRRLIEVQMERFKIIERETKTKAFSKEGLAAAAKVDPRQKERNATREWLNSCCDELKQQVEQLEAEIENMSTGKKKKSKANDERTDQINEQIGRHNFHVQKFEMLMRLLDQGEHEGLDRQIKDNLEDDIRYYIDENTDPDFAENEYMYDDFDEILEGGGAPAVSATVIEAQKKVDEEEKRKEDEKLKKIREKKVATEKKAKEEADAKRKAEQAQAKASAAAKAKAEAAKASSNQGLVAVGGRVGKQQSGDSTPSQPAQPRIPAGGINFAAAASSTAAAAAPKASSPPGAVSPGNAQQLGSSWGNPPQGGQQTPTTQQGGYPNRGGPGGAQQGVRPGGAGPGGAGAVPGGSASRPPAGGQQGGARPPQGPGGAPGSGGTSGGAGEPPAGTLARSLQLLSTASVLLPEQQEQTRSYTPANPHPTPASYPDQPPAHFNQPSFYATMDTDTLLFIFYYQQGTYQQYLAARELKKQAWRFHKKYLTWFQRHEEPKIITDEYEQGTYVYFDFEAGWCQRKKTDFTFEYRFLEDHDLP